MNDCVLSERAPNSAGYARVNQELHHRMVWEQTHGPIPEGMCVCHTCDVRNCINLEHLFLGTKQDNTLDMVSKGRHGGQLKTHCVQGHEFTPENTYVWNGWRACRACRNQRSLNYQTRKGA